jgi:hypothetical protein
MVIHRKISAGNKTDAGAQALACLASLATTCRQQGQSFFGWVLPPDHRPRTSYLLLAAAGSSAKLTGDDGFSFSHLSTRVEESSLEGV